MEDPGFLSRVPRKSSLLSVLQKPDLSGVSTLARQGDARAGVAHKEITGNDETETGLIMGWLCRYQGYA